MKKFIKILILMIIILSIVFAVIYFTTYKIYKGKIVQITTYERVSDMSTSLGEVYKNTCIVFEMVNNGEREYHYFHTNNVKIMNKWRAIDVDELKEGDIIKILKNVKGVEIALAETMEYNGSFITPIRNIDLVKIIK